MLITICYLIEAIYRIFALSNLKTNKSTIKSMTKLVSTHFQTSNIFTLNRVILIFFSVFFSFSKDFDGEATFTMNNRGNCKLIYNGYQYTKHNMTKSMTNWRCRHKNCKGKARTQQIGFKEMVQVMQSHIHPPR